MNKCANLLLGVAFFLGVAGVGYGQECATTSGYRPSSHCESCSSKRCCEKECSIRIPSIRFGFSIGCDSCRKCENRDHKCSWWESMEPPEGRVLFAVPALPVREQAIAVNPLVRSAEVPEPRRRCETSTRSSSETEMLLLLLMLQQQQREREAAPRIKPTSNTESTKEIEERLLRRFEAELFPQNGQ